MSMAVDTFSNMAQRIDPDIQATLSDFLTYTEHFPAHLIRALTLIQSETIRTEKKIAAIHADTTLYSLLPTLPPNERKDPIQLRRDISYALEEAERAGRMRLEEASRLADTAVREQARLAKLVDKLKAIPLPSRDPTPEDEGALTSPNLSRTARFGVEITGDRSARRLLDKAAGKLRARKIIVPGEVLPPPDPNAPPDTFSDWSSSESEEERRITPRPRSRTPKLKYDRSDREERDRKAARPRGPRLPGQPGTNAHSAVAGISTSNALLALNPPPADAQPGSKWLPWTKLTEWELAKLRKRMKKNAIWVPSATMVRRELKLLGRGITGREAARATAESGGPAFVDESTEPDPTRLFSGQPLDQTATPAPPIVLLEGDDADDEELINRGMRLNEAKKLKRARLLEEQREAAEQIAREQAESPEAVVVKSPETSKKRKRESTPIKQQETKAESPDLLRAAPPSRRIKLNNTTEDNAPESNTTLKPAGNERRKTSTPPAAARRATITIKAAKAASEEPQNRRASLRRGSNVSILNDNLIPARVKGTTRKNKRPAPGVIKTDDEESARVSNSKRKAAPRKRGSKQAVEKTLEIQEEEHIDPNEPRYCICGDVSWGTMIACENEGNCEKEWFHLSCVGLDDLPPRRTKWYCPDCRKKLKIGQSSNGLVGK